MPAIRDALADRPPGPVDREPHLVYVLDSGLRLVGCNEPWRRFARENGGGSPTTPGRSVLDGFTGSARARWAGVYEKLLSGEVPSHSERFACPSPTTRRVYRLTIRPLRDDQGRVSRLVHRTRLLECRPARRKDRRPAPLHQGIAGGGLRSDAVRIAGVLRPLEGAGGDLIWERRREDGGRAVVIADVMGHGELAGRVAGLIRAILDGLPPAPPGEAIRGLNDELVRRLPGFHDETMFATGLYLDVDPARARLRVSNFAHFGLLFSERGIIDPPGGLPVGMFPSEGAWPEAELALPELGRRLMAYTDGVVEQFDESGAMFGTTGLLRVFRDTLDLGLETSLPRIMADVDRYRGQALIKDDQSLLAVELGG